LQIAFCSLSKADFQKGEIHKDIRKGSTLFFFLIEIGRRKHTQKNPKPSNEQKITNQHNATRKIFALIDF